MRRRDASEALPSVTEAEHLEDFAPFALRKLADLGRPAIGKKLKHHDGDVIGPETDACPFDGELVHDDCGRPFWRILLARRDQFEILDTWYTTGLRGTGSNDYRAQDLFVPEEHSFSFLQPAKRAGALWARPDTLLRKMAGVPLGVAADAIDTAIAMLADKTDRLSGMAYRDMPRVQLAVAEAQALLGAARSYVFTSLEAQWRKLEAGETPSSRERPSRSPL